MIKKAESSFIMMKKDSAFYYPELALNPNIGRLLFKFDLIMQATGGYWQRKLREAAR
jgi:hypothetical protein